VKLNRALLLCLMVTTIGHMPAAFARPFADTNIAEVGETSSDTGIAGTRGLVNSTSSAISAAQQDRVHIEVSSQTASAATSDSQTVTLTFPSDIKAETLKVVLNGKDVTGRFAEVSCSNGTCEAASLTTADGLITGKNVIYQDHTTCPEYRVALGR
jgi:hypothetical protein